MTKVLHEYKNVQVPVEAKELIDVIYAEARLKNPRIRKADLWLGAVKLLKGEL